MEGKTNICEKSFIIKGTKVIIKHKPLPVKLRATFGTSHSSTTTRTNSLIEIQLPEKKMSGYAEIGLPPKKKGCYLADPNDIAEYMRGYYKYLDQLIEKNTTSTQSYEIGKIPVDEPLKTLFYAMDTCPMNSQEYSVAARNGIECALYDLFGLLVNKPVYELLHGVKSFATPCFYSLGIGPEEETIKNLKFAMQHTNFIKVKLNLDVKRAEKIFALINDLCNQVKDYKGKWVADMNTGGNLEVAYELLEKVFKKYPGRFYMLEQPFPQDVPLSEIPKWIAVKNAYEKAGFLIYADESISTFESIAKYKDMVSGINIKLEKCGGFRGAMKCFAEAKKLGLKIWVGIMVGTSVLSSMAAMLSPIADYDDCAGDLLVSDDSQPFECGFIWDLEGGVIRNNGKPGLGLTLKKH